MSARLLAAFCLTLGLLCVCRAQSVGAADSSLLVYLRTDANQSAAPLTQMEREASALLRTAGYLVEWRNLDAGTRETGPLIAVVEMRGTCDILPGSVPSGAPAPNGESLATTSVTDGHVLPFSTVNCGAITRALAPALRRDASAQRDFLYGRAVGRVVAHELYHILTRTTEHSRIGVARSCFSNSDLLAERFEFESATLAQMRGKVEVGSGSASIGEMPTDR